MKSSLIPGLFLVTAVCPVLGAEPVTFACATVDDAQKSWGTIKSLYR